MKFEKLILAFALLASSTALAHEAKGPHGGRIVDAGPYHAELVTKESAVEIYLTDEADKPVAVSGFKGVAILNVGGKTERVTLAPHESGALSGKASVPLPQSPKGAVQLTGPGGKTASAKFN